MFRGRGDYHDPPPAKRQLSSNDEEYTDLHRGILQIMFNERLVPENDLKVRAIALGAKADTLRIDGIMERINKKLAESMIKMEVRREEYEKSPDEEGPDEYYFVLRQITTGEKSEKVGFSDAFFTENCVALKKAEAEVLRRILLGYKKKFVGNTKRSFSFYFTEEELTQDFCAVAMLEKFTDLKWLRKVKFDGRTLYFLGLKAMAEFRTFFFDEKEVSFIPECIICTNLTFFGVVCPNKDCLSALHKKCAASYLKGLSVGICPNCSRSWENINLDGTEQLILSAGRMGHREEGHEDEEDNSSSDDDE